MVSGESPARPGTTYALSKEAAECALRYLSDQHGLSTIAIRFPWVMSARLAERIRQYRQPLEGGSRVRLNEAFAYIDEEDAARLVARIVEADLPGYRCYLPASRGMRIDEPVAGIVRRLFPEVPVRGDPATFDNLVDLRRITADTGWEPAYRLHGDGPSDA